jgi:phage/plasmid primase-like uncharacterized protein
VTSVGLHDLAARLGLKRAGREWRGACPACGYGSGAFVLTASKGGTPIGWCASCQDREAIAQIIGGDTLPKLTPDDAARVAAARERKQDRALSLWSGSEPAAGTPADRYLTGRGLPGLAASDALRFRGDCPHPEGGRYPAMVALVSDASGAGVAVHRTFLQRDGSGKAGVEPVRAGLGPVWGGAVRLHDHDPSRPLVIGEGIETAASAGRLMGLPSWVAVNAGNMAKGLVLPPAVRRVVIAADPDVAGRNAARDAWIRWHGEGREVRIAMPDGTGDFNDLLASWEVASAS